MASPLFELITEIQVCIRRDFPLADSTLLNPVGANPLVEGEWLELNSSYQLARGAAGSGVHECVNACVFPVHTERGRYDTQALGKATVIYLGMYEAETLVHGTDVSGLAVGDVLTVQDVTFQSLTRRGLAESGGLDERIVVGFVSKVTGTGATAKVRFVHFGNQKVTAV